MSEDNGVAPRSVAEEISIRRESRFRTMKRFALILPVFIAIVFLASASQAEPLTVRDAVKTALANNPSLAESRLGVDVADQGIISSRGAKAPKVSLDMNAMARQFPYPFIPAQSSTTPAHFSDTYGSLGVTMTLPVYQGGQIENGIKLSEVRKAIQEQSLNMSRNEIIANTVNVYYKIIQLKKLREASQTSVNALEELYKNMKLLFDVGRVAHVDVLKVEVQLANEKQRLLSIDEGISTLMATLRYLMGEPPGGTNRELELSDDLTLPEISTDFEQAIVIAHARRPEYLSAMLGIQESELNVNIAQGKLKPTVNAVTGYSDQFALDLQSSQGSWFVGIGISIPVSEKILKSNLARERLQTQRTGKRLTAVDNQISLEIQTAIAALKDSRNRVETAKQVINSADESFRIEQEKYKSGAGIMSDLLLAQAADIAAAANYTQALFDYNTAVVAYTKATGTLEEYQR